MRGATNVVFPSLELHMMDGHGAPFLRRKTVMVGPSIAVGVAVFLDAGREVPPEGVLPRTPEPAARALERSSASS